MGFLVYRGKMTETLNSYLFFPIVPAVISAVFYAETHTEHIVITSTPLS